MNYGPFFDYWRAFWRAYFDPPRPTCPAHEHCSLDELSKAWAEHLESTRTVADGAAKNVEDAERLIATLNAILERKRQAQQPPKLTPQ
jgi:hypothetical protein